VVQDHDGCTDKEEDFIIRDEDENVIIQEDDEEEDVRIREYYESMGEEEDYFSLWRIPPPL
jgi:hypothetical protein